MDDTGWRERFWWESRPFANAREMVRLPLGSLLFAAYLVTGLALLLPYETPPTPDTYLSHSYPELIVAIAFVMAALHGSSMVNWIRGWGRKILYLLSAGTWSAWAVVLYQGGRHIGSAYACLFALGALNVYWQLPTRNELRG